MERDFIKLKQIAPGIVRDPSQEPFGLKSENLYVQVTKDKSGMTMSIEEYTFPLEPFGIEIIYLYKAEENPEEFSVKEKVTGFYTPYGGLFKIYETQFDVSIVKTKTNTVVTVGEYTVYMADLGLDVKKIEEAI